MLHRLATLVSVAFVPLLTASLLLAGTAASSGCLGSQASPPGAFAPASAGGDPSSKNYDETAAGAPPISLPAPVTGRLTTTTPDANMASLMIGDVFAAPSGALVMAVNDSEATAFWELISFLIPSAYAASFPDVCGLPFHACAFAGPEGDFEFSLQAEIGDKVSIGIIDASTGAWLSAVVQRVIPPNVRALPRRVNQVAFAAKEPDFKPTLYSLMPSTGGDPKGLVEIFDLESQTGKFVPFVGSSPSRVDVNSGHFLAAITDPVGNFVAFVNLLKQNFEAPPQAPVSNPTDVALSYDASRAAVATNPDIAVARIMQIIDVGTLGTVDVITKLDLPISVPSLGIVEETTAIDHVSLYTSEWIDLYAFIGRYSINGPDDVKPYLGFVSNNAADYKLIGFQELPTGCLPRDVAFDFQNDIFIACGGINKIVRYPLTVNWPAPPFVDIGAGTTVPDPTNAISDPLRLIADGRVDGLATMTGSNHVYVTVRDGDATHPDSVLTLKNSAGYAPSKRNDAGLVPTGMAIDHNGLELFLSSDRSHAITNWRIDDLK